MQVQKTLSFQHELWSKIDKQRGDGSRFIAKILAEMLDTSKDKSDSSELGRLQTKGEETQ